MDDSIAERIADASSAGPDGIDMAPSRLRRAEAVLQRRTGRFAIVLEKITDALNQGAVIRSAEAMGIQYIFIVDPPVARRQRDKAQAFATKVTKNCNKWLTVRSFETTADCVAFLKYEGWSVWATDLSQTAVCLDSAGALGALPPRVAVVIGRETDGVSAEMLAACDRRVFLPMHGFTESFNLSVATALVLQRLFDACPEARGDLPDDVKAGLRREWFEELSRNATSRYPRGVRAVPGMLPYEEP
jgi:tRNA G18 (ribose-2'-O)-methylase SpoU